MAQRIIDGVLSALAGLVSVLLSWPYWRDFEYWPESHAMWWVYIAAGYVLAVYVFYVFLGCLRTLFLHDEQARPEQVRPATGRDGLVREERP
jgi:type VI protein secretion system component VasK